MNKYLFIQVAPWLAPYSRTNSKYKEPVKTVKKSIWCVK